MTWTHGTSTEPRRPATTPRLQVVGTAVVALFVEGTLLLAAARGVSLWMLAAGHATVFLALGAWAARPDRRATRSAALLWIATAAFGPLGPAGVLLTLALERYHARRSTPLDEWHAMLFPPSRTDENAELWRRIGQRASDIPTDQEVTPFLDVLAFGSIAQRQAAIAIIAQQFQPAFAPALHAALRDPHNVIRVQAATAIAKLENEFLAETLRLETAAHASPDDANRRLALAIHYDNQAFAGLLDVTREQDCRERATSGYLQYLHAHPDDHAVRFRLARLQHRRGLWQEAESQFRQLVEAGYAQAYGWLLESLFAQNRWPELRQAARDLGVPANAVTVPEMAAAINLWAGGEVKP